MIKGALLIGALGTSCFASFGFAQSMTVAEQEILQIREKMAHSFMAALKAKDVSPVGDHYTKDAVFSILMPTRSIFFGREAIVKRYEEIFRAGSLISYESKPD